ncbi:hypothetical protein [Kribbella swartbergensis]
MLMAAALSKTAGRGAGVAGAGEAADGDGVDGDGVDGDGDDGDGDDGAGAEEVVTGGGATEGVGARVEASPVHAAAASRVTTAARGRVAARMGPWCPV